ncbi:MAG: acetylxylan esterase [Muribaculaceae bacterium]|nr:acetylxylan esterase [Muribaculaceae bacterium]
MQNIIKNINRFFFVAVAAISFAAASAQVPTRQYITVVAEPDHADWTYRTGETAHITVYAIKENARMANTEITYSYGPDKLDAVKTASVTTDSEGMAHFDVPGAKSPGFINVRVKMDYEGNSYSSMTNIAFDPYSIEPTTTMPADFEKFWNDAKAEAAKVEMITTERRNPDESNAKVDVYYVKIQSYKEGTFVYGVLTVPKKPGRKPAILRLPGAAVRSFKGPHELANEGFVVLEIGVHGIPVDQPKDYYRKLEKGALANYTSQGIDNRDTYYYKRAILGCVRAIDYLCSRDDVDSSRIATYGGSQGGMLSIMTAALDKRVSALFAYFPAFCDVTGYHYGRGGGWPHLFRNPKEANWKARMEVSRYYDTVNFARILRTPGFYAWGFNDHVCCPTSTFSAYNVITAPKELHVARDTGHWLYPWQTDMAVAWLKSQFGMK